MNKLEKMIIVQMSGGLGNQMFQYAIYQKLKSMGKEVRLDDKTNYNMQDARAKQLDSFALTYESASDEEIERLTDSSRNPFCRLRRKLLGRKDTTVFEKQFGYTSDVLELDHAYLAGWWQSEAYFKDISDLLRRDFTFCKAKELEQSQIAKQITAAGKRAVSIHIRRGDYLSEQFFAQYGGICTDEYYEKAIKEIQKQIEDPVFFLFSNDMEWVKQQYRGANYIPVEGHNEDNGALDLYYMSQCRHHIIANSSFSWWGSWLNPNPNKIIVAPPLWIHGKDCTDIYTKEMVRMSV